MNKLFTKIVGAALGATMAIGVGVAVASNRDVAKVEAAGSTFQKITSTDNLTSGSRYLIVSETDNLAFDGSLSTIDAVSNTKSVTINDNSITTTSDFYFTISSKSGGYSIKGSGGLYIGSTSTTSGGKNELMSSATDDYTNTITWSNDSSSFIIKGKGASYLVYNSSSGQTRFRFYKSATSNAGKGTGAYHKVSLFKETSSDTLQSINLASTSKGTTALTSASVKTGKTLQVYLTGNYKTAGTVDKTSEATWVSGDSSVATVTNGLISGVAVGTTTISASFGGLGPVSLDLEVKEGPKVTLSRAQISLFHENETLNTITISSSGFSGTPSFTAASNSQNVAASILQNGNLQIVGGNNISADETVDITVTGNDGNDSASATLKVYLKAPVFTLSSEALNLLPTKSGSVTATVDKFLGEVSLSAVSSNPTSFSATTSGTTITITATSVEGNGTVTVTATDGTITRTKTISVVVADVLVYDLVTDADDLVEGSKIIVGCQAKNVAWGTNGAKYFSAISTTISGNKITGPSSDVLVADLEGEKDDWYLHTSEGYLSYSGSSNEAYVSETKDDTCSWSISISNGATVLESNKVSGRTLQYNASNPRFACYSSSQTAIQLYGILAAGKTVTNTRLNTENGSISAKVNDDSWKVSGFVFEVQYDEDPTWVGVTPTYTVTESVPTSYDDIGSYKVHFKVTFKDVDYYAETEFDATVLDDMTPISSFYDGTIPISSTATTEKYTYRGTVIAIEGTSYYIQQGEYGILVYGGSTQPAEGMKVGDLVAVNSKIINFNNYVVEANSITSVSGRTCRIMGTGTLPTSPIITTVAAFNAANESTRITFNGLSRNDEGEKITWLNTWAQNSSHGVAQVKDSAGATIYLYVSKYLSSQVGAAIVAKINQISTDDTFDVFQGVVAVNTNNSGTAHSAGTRHLSITSADNITIHTPSEDHVQVWIDLYMQMNNPDFDGDGTGKCKDDNYYVNAKAALNALEEAHPGSKSSFQSESKYSAALARYLKWAAACHDSQPFVGSTIKGANTNMPIESTVSKPNLVVIIIVTSAITLTAVGGYFFIRRRKHN